ncbi:MAG TPA: YceI family protein [Kofleriaceae bacterium]|nr:YceI family protein [Kofleriaceae bacterium]
MTTQNQTAKQYTFDLSHSSVNFHVRHLMISKVHGRFTRWNGTLAIDEADLSRSRVAVEIEAASIDTKEPKRDDHLRSADFFDVEKFPTLTFASTKVEAAGDEQLRVTGDLTIHGVTRSVVLDVERQGEVKDPWGGVRAGFSATTSISRKEFGLHWNAVLEAGGVAVGDKVTITLEIEAILATAAAAA